MQIDHLAAHAPLVGPVLDGGNGGLTWAALPWRGGDRPTAVIEATSMLDARPLPYRIVGADNVSGFTEPGELGATRAPHGA